MNITPEKAARKLRKKLHGDITFESLTNYISSINYTVLLFQDDDENITRYNLNTYASGKLAFTQNGEINIIFIRENMPMFEKVRLLLHEIGHILLGDFEGDRLRTEDPFALEFRANHFAHLVLCPKKLPAFLKPLGAFILATSLLTSLSFNYIQYNNHIQSTEQIINTTAVTPPQQEQGNNVYITATGSKYHTADCQYATNSAEIRLEEAKKLFSPCKKCNP